MRFVLLLGCAAACAALGFVWREPWIGAVGLLVAFAAMFTDRDDVPLDDEKRAYEPTATVRKMRARDR